VVGAAGYVEAAVVARLDQRPGLLLLVRLRADEFHDVRVVGVEDRHLRCAAGLSARLDDPGERIVAAHERYWTARHAPACEWLARGAERGEVRAGAGAALEEARFRGGQLHDRLHRVLDRVDEAGAGLRPGIVRQADVEPDRAVERRLLMEED